MWVTGHIDFKPGLADIVRLSGDLQMTVDGLQVPGFASDEDGASVNDWLRELHNLLYPGDVELAAFTRDLKDEHVRFQGEGDTTFLRVTKGGGRAIPGFEKVPLDRDQLVQAVSRLEVRIRDLLEKMTTAEHAAAWWEGVTFVPITRAGVPVTRPVPYKKKGPVKKR